MVMEFHFNFMWFRKLPGQYKDIRMSEISDINFVLFLFSYFNTGIEIT
jgi:hypothetical protein